MKEYVISRNDAGQRLDRFTVKVAPSLPASLVQKYIRVGRIKANGKRTTRDYRLIVGDVIHMYVNDEFFETTAEESMYLRISNPALDIVYEDDNIMLINKPVGVLCHSDGSYDHGSIIARVQAHLFRYGEWRPREENSFTPALCNRIDRNTSGIVIAAKNAEALRIINEKMRLDEIYRYYIAVVHGVPKPLSARLEGYLFKDAVQNRVYITEKSKPGAKSAVMEYRTVAATDKLSLLECRLITGRTHQIRAQLADKGYPILGDGKYGSGQLDKLYNETKQALCSYMLAFSFKTDGGTLSYLNGKVFRLQPVPFFEKFFTIDNLVL